jgi:hypothetical protein
MNPLIDFSYGETLARGPKGDVILHTRFKQLVIGVLHQKTKGTRHGTAPLKSVKVHSSKASFTCAWRDNSAEREEQCGFASPVGANEAHPFAGINLPVDFTQIRFRTRVAGA